MTDAIRQTLLAFNVASQCAADTVRTATYPFSAEKLAADFAAIRAEHLTPSVLQDAMVPVVASAGLFTSPPPNTLARLVNVPEALSATDTGSVNVLLAPAARPVARVQVAVSLVLVVVDTAQVQRPPFVPPGVSGATKDMPAGRMSFIVVAAVVAAPPLLVTVKV
jgi:hypothetical protein